MTEKQLRFGRFRQKMCDMLWECNCNHLGLSDETNAKRIFNSANYICNKLLEEYEIMDREVAIIDNPFLCYNCIYLTNYTGNVIECSRLPRRYNPQIKCDYFKKQWSGGKND